MNSPVCYLVKIIGEEWMIDSKVDAHKIQWNGIFLWLFESEKLHQSTSRPKGYSILQQSPFILCSDKFKLWYLLAHPNYPLIWQEITFTIKMYFRKDIYQVKNGKLKETQYLPKKSSLCSDFLNWSVCVQKKH